jgi:hypothetical protein
MMRFGGFLIVMVAACVAALGGCGGGSVTSATKTITKAEFVGKANSLCKHGEVVREHKLEAANSWVKGNTTSIPLKEKIARYVVIGPTEGLVRELRKLGEVSGEPRLGSYVDKLQADVVKAGENPLEAFFGAVFEDSDLLASKVGLSACSL